MKAVVVEIEGKNAVVLAKNGSFIKVKNNKQYRVGYELELPANNVFSLYSFTKVAAVAAAVVLSMGIGLGVYAYNSPYSYINVDINPSVEITTNIFDRIINVKALNKDGEKIISHKNYKNTKVEDGITDMLENAVEEGYLKTGITENSESVEGIANAVMFTVSGKNDKKVAKIKQSVQVAASNELKAAKVESEVLVENVTIDRHDKAEEMGISPGKMLLLEKLQEAKPEARTEDYKNAPVKDIMKAIKEEKNKKVDKNTTKVNKNNPEVENKSGIEAAGKIKVEGQEKVSNSKKEYKDSKNYKQDNDDKDKKNNSRTNNDKGYDKSKVDKGKDTSPSNNNGRKGSNGNERSEDDKDDKDEDKSEKWDNKRDERDKRNNKKY